MTVTPTPVRSVAAAASVSSASEWVGMFDHRIDPAELIHCEIASAVLGDIRKYFAKFNPNPGKLQLEEIPLNVIVFRTPRIGPEAHSQLIKRLDALLEAKPLSRVYVRLNEVRECCDETVRYLAEKSRAVRKAKGELAVSYTYDAVAASMRRLGVRDDFNLHLNPMDAISYLMIPLDLDD